MSSPKDPSRRQFIENAAVVASGAAALGLMSPSQAFASDAKANSKADAAKISALTIPASLSTPVLALGDCASMCSHKGTLCVQHCQEQLAAGHTEFALCQVTSRQMSAICDAVAELASMKSVRLMQILDACNDACKACKEACEEHKAHWEHGMHMECKACAESCDEMLSKIAALKAQMGKA